MTDVMLKKVDLRSSERIEVDKFLHTVGLSLDDDVEYTVTANEGDEILGTCSFSGNVLKCFAVKPSRQGEGITSKLITHLTNVLFDIGRHETFIFTKDKNRIVFESLGYKEVHSAGGVILLEGGTANVAGYVNSMFKESGLDNCKKTAIVMNCNPFTLGHRYLIEKASKESKQVVVFVVEEDRSYFPFEARLALVREGTRDLKNVCVIAGGHYIISWATFPSYFMKRKDDRLEAYAELDAGIFGRYIAPVFNINTRYIGTEPYCSVTDSYNHAIMKILPQYGVNVEVEERLDTEGRVISASEVRRLIKTDKWDEIEKLVPYSTFQYLKSEASKDVIQNIKRSDSIN